MDVSERLVGGPTEKVAPGEKKKIEISNERMGMESILINPVRRDFPLRRGSRRRATKLASQASAWSKAEDDEV